MTLTGWSNRVFSCVAIFGACIYIITTILIWLVVMAKIMLVGLGLYSEVFKFNLRDS